MGQKVTILGDSPDDLDDGGTKYARLTTTHKGVSGRGRGMPAESCQDAAWPEWTKMSGMSSGPESSGAAAMPGLTVAAVARRLGVAPATLRTWDRRYGVGPSQHSAGSHRRYSPDDIARLERMRRLMLGGVPLAEAARAALGGGADEAEESGAVAQITGAEISRPGGGQVVPIPGGTPNARGLARAAIALDGAGCRAIVAETLDRRGVVWTWDHLLAPVLVGVGRKWEQSNKGIEVEHVLSESITYELANRVARAQASSPASVLLCAAPDETHVLPLWAVAAGLAERHVTVHMLGGRMPVDAISAAIRRIGPAGVLIWAQLSQHGDPAFVDDLPDVRPEPQVMLAGPGWWPGDFGRARRVSDLTEAVTGLARAAGA